ncbi:uncharacterized protein [Diadema antillarum]|uniref:uncharacterized protein n=1 Tax=Diadema antillarum TaxID=105358 RepID=UPI003A848232
MYSTKLTSIAQGNFNQGHYRFGVSRGKQCTANSLVAILYSAKKNANEFDAQDLDKILTLGNQLYYYIEKDSTMHEDLLMISDLPKELDILDDTFAIDCSGPVFGIIDGNEKYLAEFGAVLLKHALEHELYKHDACFMMFNESTFAIIKSPTGFYVFDPHGRDQSGCVSENGKSILLHTSCWQGIHSYRIRLANSMGCSPNSTQFELTGVNVKIQSKSNDALSSINFNQSYNDNPHENTCKTNSTKCEPCDGVNLQSKGVRNVQDNQNVNSDVEDDIEIIYIEYGDRPDRNFKFSPLCARQKRMICRKLGIDYVNINDGALQTDTDIAHPAQIKSVTGDCNCFYRAISYIISGTERNHTVLRKTTTKHLLDTNGLFSSTLSHEFRTVEEYVLKEKVMDNGTWASNTEMSAMANLLDIDIYSFNDQLLAWQLFSAKKPGRINEVTTERGIYILYTQNVHFNVVESVGAVHINSREEREMMGIDASSQSNASSVENSFAEVIRTKEIPKKWSKKGKSTEQDTKYLQTELGFDVIFQDSSEPKQKCSQMDRNVPSQCDIKVRSRKQKETKEVAYENDAKKR